MCSLPEDTLDKKSKDLLFRTDLGCRPGKVLRVMVGYSVVVKVFSIGREIDVRVSTTLEVVRVSSFFSDEKTERG